MNNPALAVFAKVPRPGLVKTRLSPPLPSDQAAAFYGAMLSDVLDATAKAADLFGATPFLVVHPGESLASMLAEAPAGFQGMAQEGVRLEDRLGRAFKELFERGYSPVLLRGSDSPGVPTSAIGQFLVALKAYDVVFGPDSNGGYYLVGMNSPEAGLFGFALSNDNVLAHSLKAARRLGMTTKTLESSYDINTASDLVYLKSNSKGPVSRKSVAFATHHDLWRYIPA